MPIHRVLHSATARPKESFRCLFCISAFLEVVLGCIVGKGKSWFWNIFVKFFVAAVVLLKSIEQLDGSPNSTYLHLNFYLSVDK